eukprot:10923657-Alexandrium_andersonii.AAC.1
MSLLKFGSPQCRSERQGRCAKCGTSGTRPWNVGLQMSADFELRRWPFGPAGELGPRPPGLD